VEEERVRNGIGKGALSASPPMRRV
jgi:hypothetical protein